MDYISLEKNTKCIINNYQSGMLSSLGKRKEKFRVYAGSVGRGYLSERENSMRTCGK